MKRKFIFFIILSVFFTTYFVLNAAVLSVKEITKSNREIIGDMVYIKGDGNIRDFYIGVSEEPNINWKLYTSWLRRIFSMDYPEISRKAEKRRDFEFEFFKFNDPYVLYYSPFFTKMISYANVETANHCTFVIN
ncbi:MAG: hypothetical protein JXR58_05790 [Bacteroidales bacterium]|nr:hypothetical protein [Bacteroidales bacterium]